MMRKLTRMMVAVVFAFFCIPAILVQAQGTIEQTITITSPKEGDSIVNTAAEINGTSPPSTIVTVIITDTDTNRPGIAHQANGKVEGTVTAGADGLWAYVPQHLLVPGQFSAQASYTNDQNRVIDSKSVHFVVLNNKGSSVQFSSSLVSRLVIWGALLVILIVTIIIFLVNRRRRMDVKKISQNADAIEEELQRTMEQLTRTNAEIAELNESIHKKRPPD
jgi:Na+-transporting methylmalonyl-CoA/oxaloacetate decarboxylase gamma subunit